MVVQAAPVQPHEPTAATMAHELLPHPAALYHATLGHLTCNASGVAVYHGHTAFTRMPSFAHSTDKFLASWFSAALLMPYSVPERMLTGPPATEELNTMLAPAAPAAALSAVLAVAAAVAALRSGWQSWHRT